MTLDIDALLKATAQEVWGEEEPSDGHLDAVRLSLAVIVPAVTAEVRALHKEASRVTYWRDALGDDNQTLVEWCADCLQSYPCPTIRLLDELDAAARGGSHG